MIQKKGVKKTVEFHLKSLKNSMKSIFNSKKICLIAIYAFTHIYSYSQEKSIFNQNYINPFLINPAITGNNYYPEANISINKEFLGIPNSPSTYSIAGNIRLGKYDFYDPKGFINTGPLKLTDRIGLGASVYQDNNGPLFNTGSILSYAYHIPLRNNSNLSFGMSITMMNYGIRSNMLDPDNQDDDFLLLESDNIFKLNFGFGAFYRSRRFFVGLSSVKLLPSIEHVNEYNKMQPSLFAITGLKIYSNSSAFIIEPSLITKKLGAGKLFMDFHTKFYFKSLSWISLSYTNFNQINVRFGLKLYKSLYIGYRYGYIVGDISSYSLGTNEITLGINLGLNDMIVFDNIFNSEKK